MENKGLAIPTIKPPKLGVVLANPPRRLGYTWHPLPLNKLDAYLYKIYEKNYYSNSTPLVCGSHTVDTKDSE